MKKMEITLGTYSTWVAYIVAGILYAPLCLAEDGKALDGAFGMQFGSTFDPSRATTVSKLDSGTPIYGFKPKKPYGAFKNYWVLITPKSHKVYEIWADGIPEINTKRDCFDEKDLIVTILRKKYRLRIEPVVEIEITIFDRLINQSRARLVKGNKEVLMSCTAYHGYPELEIRYIDKMLRNIAKKEQFDLDTKKADPSGL